MWGPLKILLWQKTWMPWTILVSDWLKLWLIDWLVFNTNFSNISAISWCAEASKVFSFEITSHYLLVGSNIYVRFSAKIHHFVLFGKKHGWYGQFLFLIGWILIIQPIRNNRFFCNNLRQVQIICYLLQIMCVMSWSSMKHACPTMGNKCFVHYKSGE